MSAPQTLRYTPIVNVDLSDNQINFADAELDGHRVQVSMAAEDLNTFFRWIREVGSDRPVGQVDNINGFLACLCTSFDDGFTDQDSIATGLSLQGSSITNTANRSNNINDLVMAYVLQKVYGMSAQDTQNKVQNVGDALNMCSNQAVALAIGDSISNHNARGQDIDQMFRDLLAADPTRFFDNSGIQVTGLFETQTDVSGNGSWAITPDDIIQVKVTFTFKEKVSRRVVSAQEQPTTAGNAGRTAPNNAEEVTEETIIQANDLFPIRLQIKATASRTQRRVDQIAAGGGYPGIPEGSGGGGGGPVTSGELGPNATFFFNNGTISQVSGTTQTNLTIPTTISGETVTAIAAFAFQNITSLETVIIPNTVVSIGENAFQGCTNLTTVTMPTTLSSLGNGTFMFCSSLQTITLPTNLTTIPNVTFRQCTSLASITIPSTVTSIGEAVFQATALTSITIPNSVRSIGNACFSGCGSLTSITLPTNASFTTLSSDLLGNCPVLSSITIPSNVTTIQDSVFSGCSTLTSVTVPSSVTSIGTYGFQNCTALTTLSLPNSITTLGDAVFQGCTSLATINIPTGLTTLPNLCFVSCSSLASVTIPSNITTLGVDVFQATGLTSITIPNTVTSIGTGCFVGCTNLTTATLSTNLTALPGNTFNGCTALTTVSIPSAVTTLGDNVFYGCTALTSVTIPSGVTSIGSSCFQMCQKITSITIPNTCTSIGDSIFENCIKLASVTLSSGLTSIPNSAFKQCIKLTSITIPSGVTSLGTNAFHYCEVLGTVSIPSTCTTFGPYCFAECVNISSMTIPSGTTAIPDQFFYNGAACTSLSLPVGLETIGEWAFYGVGSFNGAQGSTSFTIPQTVTSIDDYGFFSFAAGKANFVLTIGDGNNGQVLDTIGAGAFTSIDAINIINYEPTSNVASDAFSGVQTIQNIHPTESNLQFLRDKFIAAGFGGVFVA